MSPYSHTSTNEIKRIPIACTRCRRQKLKCRVPDGSLQCQRCIDADAECIFVPVNFDQPPLTTPSIHGQYSTQQFRLERPMGYTGAQHYPAQPTASTHHSWNMHDIGARIEPQQHQYIHHPSTHSESLYTNTSQHAGHLMPPQTQQGHQDSPAYHPSQLVHHNSQWIENMDYAIQGIVPTGEISTSGLQNVGNPASNSGHVQYGQSDPNASWTNRTNYYTVLPEDTWYYPYGSSQDQTNSGSQE